MSWMPSADPILGDKKSCDALELVVVPRVRDLGDGFEVRCALSGHSYFRRIKYGRPRTT